MDDTIRRFYRVRSTCFEMLEDRNFIVPIKEKQERFDDFQQRYINSKDPKRASMLLDVSHKTDTNNKIIVYFVDETKKTGVKPISELTEVMEQRKVQHAILVTQNVLTSFARDAINTAAPRLIIENFMESELLVNITKHELVPKHVPLSNEEKKTLLQRYKLKELQLPRIQSADPVARYFGLSKGQVVKIIRPSETAGRYVTYRLVI